MKVISTVALALVAGSPLMPAHAVDVLQTNRTNPAGNCAAAKAIYADDLRNRPLALINEGSTLVYTTCAFTTSDPSLGTVGFGTRATNLSAVAETVTCTAVTGNELDAQYFSKSITLAPGASGQLGFTGSDNGGLLFSSRVSLSCALPPGVGLNDNYVTTLLSIL